MLLYNIGELPKLYTLQFNTYNLLFQTHYIKYKRVYVELIYSFCISKTIHFPASLITSKQIFLLKAQTHLVDYKAKEHTSTISSEFTLTLNGTGILILKLVSQMKKTDTCCFTGIYISCIP